jgi:signal transduction histidine kinase
MKNILLYRQTIYHQPYPLEKNEQQEDEQPCSDDTQPLFPEKKSSTTLNPAIFMSTSVQELLLILQHLENGILAQTASGHVIYANVSAAKFLGFEDAQNLLEHAQKYHTLLNANHFTYTDLYDKKITQKNFPWHKGQKRLSQNELTMNIANNKTRDMRRIYIKSHIVQNRQLKTPVIISILTDISNVALLEKQKDEFMSMASHELKTPITSMKVFTQILQKNFTDLTDPKPLYYLGKIEGQLNKLNLLVKELLDVSRLQTGRLELHKEIFPLSDMLTEIGQQMQYATNRHTIQIQNTFKGTIFGDKERLGQVLVNLLSNAIKYSPDNSSIIVKGKRDKNKILVEVIDQGIGISKKHQKHIFDRFARVEDTQVSTFPGMGVGLYIASQIIQRHNGTLSVASKKNYGSTFTIMLPIFKRNES